MSIFYQNSPEQLRLYTSENNTFATHLHKQTELLIVLEGELTLVIDHIPHTLSQGMYALIFPNQLHSLATHTHSRILLCIFDVDFCHRYRSYFHNYLPAPESLRTPLLTPHSQTAINGLLSLTDSFPKGTAIPSRGAALAEGYLTLLLADFFAEAKLIPRTISEDLELEQKLLIYLETHYTEDLSLDILAKEFGVSRFTLSRLFTDKLHTSFPYYVNSKRLEYACNLLLSTDLSVTRIALDSGFGSSRTFFREFKATYRTTPKEYRKAHQPRQPY